MHPDNAIDQAHRIVKLIDEDVPEWAWDKAAEFFEDVRDSVCAVEDTITTTGRVTAAQQIALDNWEESVCEWIR